MSVLGQSLAAGLAEALGTIVPGPIVDGRVQFRLNDASHLITSLLAYGWTVLAVTLQAIAVSVLHAETRPFAAAQVVAAPDARGLPLRAAAVGAALALLVGTVAAVQTIQQHLHGHGASDAAASVTSGPAHAHAYWLRSASMGDTRDAFLAGT